MKRLVLVGAGHAHAQVLLSLARRRMPGVEVVLVAPDDAAPYSGMVPGWLAGRYSFDEICLRFGPLLAASGARFVRGELHALDPNRRQVILTDGSTLAYDVLSLNVGSTLTPPALPGVEVLALRPLSRLHERWESLVAALRQKPRPLTVTAVGGGAAGFESLLATLARLRPLLPAVHGRLVSRSETLLPGLAPGAVRAATAALARHGVELSLGHDWSADDTPGTDLMLWATGAEAHAWQRDETRRGTLAVCPLGFVRIDPMLRSVSHPEVHAVGDCAAWSAPLPKAGVYAVRMGPVLANNLRAALGEGRAQPYEPQSRYLVLLATGDGRAIASRGRWSADGRWVWRWKDRIDRGFLQRFRIT